MHRPLWIRFVTFLVWLLAAASAVYWALRFVQGPVAPASAAVALPSSGVGAVDTLALAKGLGGGQVAASSAEIPVVPSNLQASRFVLTGVAVRRGAPSQSIALIAVDGKPPRPCRVGSPLADGVVLHSVSVGKAMLAAGTDAAPGLTLELPQLTSAVAGNVQVSRPAISALPASIMPTPVANPTANAAPAPVQRPARPLATGQREGEKEARQPTPGVPGQ
jgi:general secretion pathway protein C